MTIKGPFKKTELDVRELDTIRPIQNKSDIKNAMNAKSHDRKHSDSTSQRSRSVGTDKAETKFAPPPKPAVLCSDQLVEDSPEVLIENENLLDRRLNLIKVGLKLSLYILADAFIIGRCTFSKTIPPI